jgi:hypothetical protein
MGRRGEDVELRNVHETSKVMWRSIKMTHDECESVGSLDDAGRDRGRRVENRDSTTRPWVSAALSMMALINSEFHLPSVYRGPT